MRFSDTASRQRGISTPAVALASVGVILLVAVPIILLLKGGGKAGKTRASYSADKRITDEKPDNPVKSPPPDERAVTAGGAGSKEVRVEEVERIAAQFMRRISSDDRPYVFPPYAVSALGDITNRIEQYSRSAAVAGALNRVAAEAPEVAAAVETRGTGAGACNLRCACGDRWRARRRRPGGGRAPSIAGTAVAEEDAGDRIG